MKVGGDIHSTDAWNARVEVNDKLDNLESSPPQSKGAYCRVFLSRTFSSHSTAVSHTH